MLFYNPRAPPRPLVNPNVPAVDIIRLKSAYLKDKGSLTTGELVALINTLLASDTEGRCDPECQEILADYFRTQEELRLGQMRKERERFGIQDQRLRYSARVMYEGKIVSDNLFSTREEAVQKAFANQIGKPVGGCVASNVRAGMSGKVVHGIAKLCSRQSVGTHLNLGGLGRSAGRSSQASEYYEIE
jgi:hypothetical protein